MRTIFILPFIFAAWIVMPMVSGAQGGKDATSPGQLASGAVQGARMESCKATTETEIASLFDRWNQSLQTSRIRVKSCVLTFRIFVGLTMWST